MVRSLSVVLSLVVVACMATESFAQGNCCGSQAVVSSGCGDQACCGTRTRVRLFSGRFTRANRNCCPTTSCCEAPAQVAATPCVAQVACNTCCKPRCSTCCNQAAAPAMTYTSYTPASNCGGTACNSCNSCDSCCKTRVRLFNRGNCCGGYTAATGCGSCGGCGAVSGGCAGCGTPSPAATISAPIEGSQAVPPVPTEGN